MLHEATIRVEGDKSDTSKGKTPRNARPALFLAPRIAIHQVLIIPLGSHIFRAK
jgi:hypothetical protein